MDHKTFLKTLSAEQTERLTKRSDRRGLRHLLGHVAVILVIGMWIAAGWPLWWVMLVVQGVTIVFLFTLEHEATHKTPFANETLNEWVGRSCGLLIVLPFEWFRYFHLAHHRFTNIADKDPELAGDQSHYDAWGPFLWHVSGVPYWGSMLRQVLVNAAGRADAGYLPERAKPRIEREARWVLAIYVLALISLIWTPVLLWVWIVPLLLGQPFLRLYLMAEHGRCPQVANMLDNSRTTYTNAVVRFLAWNMPYHTEHHVFPSVPFYQLPELNRLIQQDLLHEQDGYAAFTRETIEHL
ncbi:Fatty acid desaturase [Shimia gijangensis]|uniref:Fatty acid desaturase n=1 Tax=Shimia gijangensis TaxID=1470563 RepID=A0A1M6B0B6_9RHOB|nr:fatty acid desaturase [Shimia gijangensis]SHI42189.1 Fatty acid desaturase [Shimia gijangensis]